MPTKVTRSLRTAAHALSAGAMNHSGGFIGFTPLEQTPVSPGDVVGAAMLPPPCSIFSVQDVTDPTSPSCKFFLTVPNVAGPAAIAGVVAGVGVKLLGASLMTSVGLTLAVIAGVGLALAAKANGQL